MPHEDEIGAYGSEHNLDTLEAARMNPREVGHRLTVEPSRILTIFPSYFRSKQHLAVVS